MKGEPMSPTGPSDSITRAARAAFILYQHAVYCDETDRPQMARVMWAKYAELAPRVELNTLRKNTGLRLW